MTSIIMQDVIMTCVPGGVIGTTNRRAPPIHNSTPTSVPNLLHKYDRRNDEWLTRLGLKLPVFENEQKTIKILF